MGFKKKVRKDLSKLNSWFRPKYDPIVEELNQFIFGSTQTDDEEYLKIEKRVDIEERILKHYQQFANKSLDKIQGVMENDPELEVSYKALKDANNVINLGLDDYLTKIKDLPNTVTNQINEIFTDSSMVLWDLPGAEIDRIIIGREVINREADATSELDIGIIADELALASLGKHHVPLICEQIANITDEITRLPEQISNYKEKLQSFNTEKTKNLLIEVASVFLGKILGIREPILLAQKQLKRYLELKDEIDEESKEIGSTFLESIYDQIIDLEEIEESISKIDNVLEIVTNNSEQIRQIYVGIENSELKDENSNSIKSFVEYVAELYHTLEDFRFISEFFEDIPSYTSMGGGTVAEQDEELDIDIPDEYVIYAQEVFKTFPLPTNTVYALRGVDIKVKQGEFVAIQGPSGSGKTTLLNILSGLDQADRGIVSVAGLNLNTASENELVEFRRNKVSFIYQAYNLLPNMTNKENVRLPADFGSNKDLGDHDVRAEELLQSVGLEGYENGFPLRLSGGQQQRVTISRALMNKPEIIFADEPTGDLDTTTGLQIMDVIEKFNERGVSIILVTHDPDIANRADRIIAMTDGKIVEKAEH